jgi:alkylated DNA repair dioxygenase AlkB
VGVDTLALTWQACLFGSLPPSVDRSFVGLERIWLDGDSWVDHSPGWLSGSDELFADLIAQAPWGQRRRWMYDRHVDEPRLTSWHKVDEARFAPPTVVEDARAALSEYYEVTFDSVGLNLYRQGSDSVAWHRDRIPASVADPVVALVSLGEPRRFLLRPARGGRSRRFKLGQGDLLVTGGQAQRRFEHSVPKAARAGPRMSIAFRHGMVRPDADQLDQATRRPGPSPLATAPVRS